MTFPAAADEPVRPANFPNCTKYQIAVGGLVCGYENIEDWKLVLRADAELTHVREQLKNEEVKDALLHVQLEQAVKEAAARSGAESILKTQNEKLTNDLIALDEKYQKERVKTVWGSPIAWGLAAVSTALLAGFVIHDVIN